MLSEWTEKKEKLCGRSHPCWSDFIKTLKLWPDLLFKFLVKAKVGKNYLRKVKTSKKISNYFIKQGNFPFFYLMAPTLEGENQHSDSNIGKAYSNIR